MASFGDNLKELRLEHGYSIETLAKLYNEKFGGRLNKSTISRYENNLQEPIITVVKNFAQFFHVTSDYLVGNVSQPFFRLDNSAILREVNSYCDDDEHTDFIDRVVPIRFLGSVAAGYNQIANDEHEYLNVPEDWLGRRRPNDFFALRVKGDSMYPKYCNGDEILCLHDESPAESGQVYVVLYGDDEATLKKIECSPNEGYIDLVPINPMFPPKRIEGADLDQFRILGRVVRLIRTEDKDIEETK